MATAMIIEDLPQALRSRSTEVHTFGRTAAAPHETGPHETGPHQTGPHQTGPHQTGPHQTGRRDTEM
jgi:hypothetical protein